MASPKKLAKQQLKRDKKSTKLAAKAQKANASATHDEAHPSSHAVRYAEFVRGCLYLLSGTSLIVALVLGQRGAIISLDDIIDSLFAASTGKVVLGLIGLALLLYGLKHLRLIR